MAHSDERTVFRAPPAALADEQSQLEPFEWYERMRRTAPVQYDDKLNRWHLFRYEDVATVLRDHERFTADISSTDIELVDGDPFETPGTTTSMLRTAPPDHSRRRSFATPRFQPGTIAEHREEFGEIAADLLDSIEPNSTVELIDAFTHPFPITVIASLLGLPAVEYDRFREWSLATTELSPTDASAARQAREEMRSYFSKLVRDRADGDGDDLISLAASNDALSHEETVTFCTTILVAGNVTTVNLITSALWCFAEFDLFDDVRSGAIDRETVIEEVLRYRPPAQSVRRVTTEPVTLCGTQIDANELLVAYIGSANRDPVRFDEPETFVPERTPNPHLTFGGGIHFCLGAQLARLEADIAIECLLDRFSVIEPDCSSLRPQSLVYGVRELPCYLEP
ncbi:cytochrome P450 [Halocatena halophila]|uniref:cytochrome P450 n=1 Tax=Halocatena halophila TaxID=2814576 RepID=UPI002ED5B70E